MPLVAAAQPDEKALKPLLTIEDEALFLGVLWDVEVAQAQRLLPVVDELAPPDVARGLPDQQRADRVLAKDRVEQATDLVFAPYERPLNVREPEATVFLGIVSRRVVSSIEVSHDEESETDNPEDRGLPQNRDRSAWRSRAAAAVAVR